MTVFCIGGASAAGKSTLASAISTEFSIPRISFSDLLRMDAAALGIDPTTQNLQDLGSDRISNGWGDFVSSLTSMLDWPPPKPAVIEGIRHRAALDLCRAAAAPLEVVFIYLELESSERHERIAERNRDERTGPEVDAHSVEAEATSLGAAADLVLHRPRRSRNGSVSSACILNPSDQPGLMR